MQSSLLSLALANTFFEDPSVGIASAISVSCPLLKGFLSVCMHFKNECMSLFFLISIAGGGNDVNGIWTCLPLERDC